MLHIRVIRSGGFTGIPAEVSLPADRVEESDRKLLMLLAESIGGKALPMGKKNVAARPDRFVYLVELVVGGRNLSFTLREEDLEADVKTMLKRLLGNRMMGHTDS